MNYVHDSVGSAYLPKLLGICERELNSCIEAICQLRPNLIVDIGAGEGYYAVGLAVRNPEAKIIAFEMRPIGQRAVVEMAALNGVETRVKVCGKCERADLIVALDDNPRPVIVCDIEGDEEGLMDPVAVPALRRAHILAELHEFVIPGVTASLRNRFAASHFVREIQQQPRSRTEFPWRTLGTFLLPASYLDWAVSEWRPAQMSWLWMEPKN